MPELHVPLTSGATEGIDPKVLPQGRLLEARNVRYRKDGRISSRYGYDYVTGASTTAIASASTDDANVNLTVTRRSAFATPAAYSIRSSNGFRSGPTCYGIEADIGVPRRYPVTRMQLERSATMTDIVAFGPYVFVATVDSTPSIEYGLAANTNGRVDVYEAATGAFVTTALTISSAYVVKLVKHLEPGVIGVFHVAGLSAIKYTPINATTFAVGTEVVCVTAYNAALAREFDVSDYNNEAGGTGLSAFLAYVKASHETGGNTVSWGRVSATGTYEELATKIITNLGRYSIGYAQYGDQPKAVLVYEQADAIKYTEWTTVGVFIEDGLLSVAPACRNPVVAGTGPDAHWTAAWDIEQVDDTYPTHVRGVGWYSKGTNNGGRIGGKSLCAKPFRHVDGVFLWTTDRFANYTASDAPGSYFLVDATSVDTIALEPASVGTVCCQLEACPRDYLSYTQRSSVHGGVAVAAVDTRTPGLSAVLSYLAVTKSGLTERNTPAYGADLIRIESGDLAPRFNAARINGQLIVSGPRVFEWDSSALFESGFDAAPHVVAHFDVDTDTPLSAGAYSYVFVFEWFDAQGRRNLSAPSAPVDVTLDGVHGQEFRLAPSTTSSRTRSMLRVYRTLVNGTVYYLVNTTTAPNASIHGLSVVTWQDLGTVDASTLATHETLYTQGERGALSGMLANDPPPPARYICASPDRVLAGGLEDPTAVQWSKLRYPGEPIAWSFELVYRSNVPGEVTAVAVLDGAWLVATRDAWYSFVGPGPDDLGGGGTFGEARAVASVGCISHRSVREVPQGLLFQNANDKFYLLPRGGGQPVEVGQAVKDTLTAYPIVTDSASVPNENIVVFSVVNASGTVGRLLVYDTRTTEWTVDEIGIRAVKSLSVFGGALVLDGCLHETVGTFADDQTGSGSAVIATRITTGDVRPFGVIGDGRTRKVALLGEYRNACTVLIEVSYDSGQSWPDSATFSLSGRTAGDPVELEHHLKYVRGCAYRFRITVTPAVASTDGVYLNALSFEVFQERGTKRLANAYRG